MAVDHRKNGAIVDYLRLFEVRRPIFEKNQGYEKVLFCVFDTSRLA